MEKYPVEFSTFDILQDEEVRKQRGREFVQPIQAGTLMRYSFHQLGLRSVVCVVTAVLSVT
eukprot:1464029-Amphidinium_carterae.1